MDPILPIVSILGECAIIWGILEVQVPQNAASLPKARREPVGTHLGGAVHQQRLASSNWELPKKRKGQAPSTMYWGSFKKGVIGLLQTGR